MKTLISIDIKNISNGILIEFTHNGTTYVPKQPTKQPTQPKRGGSVKTIPWSTDPPAPIKKIKITPIPKPSIWPTPQAQRRRGRIIKTFDDTNIYKNVLDYCIIAKRNNIPCKTQGDALQQFFPKLNNNTRLHLAYKYSSYIKQAYTDKKIPLRSINIKKRLTAEEAVALRGPSIGKQGKFTIHERPVREILENPSNPKYTEILTKYYPNTKNITTYIYVYKKWLKLGSMIRPVL